MLYEVITKYGKISADEVDDYDQLFVYAQKLGLHRITSYNVCYTKLLRKLMKHLLQKKKTLSRSKILGASFRNNFV